MRYNIYKKDKMWGRYYGDIKTKRNGWKIDVTVLTLQRWDNNGILKAYRTPTNRRYYTEEQYLKYIGRSTSNDRKNVAYARVSTYG